MLIARKNEFKAALLHLGVESGDGLLVHSAIQYLGKPEGGTGMYWEALSEVLGEKGTVAVPAFNFDFAKGEPFDPTKTPSEGMGVFSAYIRSLPGSMRTQHPMQSLVVIGALAGALAEPATSSAFDDGSVFDLMLSLDFKLLLLGADIQSCSMVHYSEQRAEVPYRYWKEFSGKVRTEHGWEEKTCRMFVRDMGLDPRLRLAPIQAELTHLELWREEKMNYGWLSLCRLQDFVRVTDRLLRLDPWCLVERKPTKDDHNA
jgi:aminoglycoside 3-N-acetyltransferase